MSLEYYQDRKNKFEIGDLVCYKSSGGRNLCGIITEINKIPKSNEKGEMVKIYWCIDKEITDISPLSYPPVRKNGWVAAGLLLGVGNLEIVSKKTLDGWTRK
tara:strand:- start:600 stop:905 length:306 start_codon:yes stop_codon:yes gene_type:complete